MRAFISAYGDAISIIEIIKPNRAESHSAPPSRSLEDSIDQSSAQVERIFDEYIANYGEAFEEGDSLAVIEIQRATINLHGGILRILRDALRENGSVENALTELAELAGEGRDRAVDALGQLATRLEQTGFEGDPADRHASIIDKPILESSNESTTAEPPVQRRIWTREYNSSGDEDSAGGTREERSDIRRRRHASLLNRLKYGHSRQKPNTEDVTKPSDVPLRPESKTSHPTVEGASPASLDKVSVFPSTDWTLQPRDRASTRGTLSVSPHSLAAPIASPTFILNTAERRNGSVAIPHPSPDNDYLGFCEGAWRLWTGDSKAMKRSRDMSSGHLHSTVYYLTCSNSKCAFESHINLDRIWTQVWKLPEQGIKFRWPFLAKSHVLQKGRIRGEMFAFQCMFCVFLDLPDGEEGRTLYYGYEEYLGHIAQEHRGKPMGDIVLYKIGCVNDRICEDDEEFDINLYPPGLKDDRVMSGPTSGESRPEEAQAESGARLSDAKSEDEPWNAGLSEFHMGDMELIDRRFTREGYL